MPDATHAEVRWLSLQDAAERLDVHPATLRDWADRGRLRTFRTPGGHRRFSEDDVSALAASKSPELALFMNATVGRARMATSAGELASQPWYAQFDESAKERQRKLGHELMRLLVAFLADMERDWTVDIRKLGDRYAGLAHDSGLSLGDAMRAFHLFEGLVHSSVSQMSAAHVGGAHDLERSAAWFLNEVRVAMVESFAEVGR